MKRASRRTSGNSQGPKNVGDQKFVGTLSTPNIRAKSEWDWIKPGALAEN